MPSDSPAPLDASEQKPPAKPAEPQVRRWRGEPKTKLESTPSEDEPTEDESNSAPAGNQAHWLRRIFGGHEMGAWFTSVLVHAALFVVLGLCVREAIRHSANVDLSVRSASVSDEPLESLPGDAALLPSPKTGPLGGFAGTFDGDPLTTKIGDAPIGLPDLGTPEASSNSSPTSQPAVDLLSDATNPTRHGAFWGKALSKGGGGLGGRSLGRRGQLVNSGGGTPGSEAAVERGLKWLLAHQRESGGWQFHFDGPPCDNLCRNGGPETSTTGATAVALLPFYGAGYTHTEGAYAEQVNRGLYYLGGRMLVTPQGGDLQEGTMYAQGLSTICLCEAYAMSKDANLRPYAQQAINYILYAQDRHTGGWRYFPGQAGDTTVTGWQLMALKSAQLAGLEIPSSTYFLANKFLDSVQTDKGAAYGYLRPGDGAATSAVGLLCRMYLGWSRRHSALLSGVNALDKLGPSPTDMYFNYYATQVMYHHGGNLWERWNYRMRDFLIRTQSDDGHESGSWFFADSHSDKGGRLLNTALAVLTLEVYYRYLPIYSNRAVDEGF